MREKEEQPKPSNSLPCMLNHLTQAYAEKQLAPALEVPPPFRNHAPYAEDFGRWALVLCVFRDGCWGGIAALHKHFCAWCAKRGEAGPWLATFAALLADEGFMLEGGIVYGLLFRQDEEASHAGPPSAPTPRVETGATRMPIR